jgi:acid phosphatase type 7
MNETKGGEAMKKLILIFISFLFMIVLSAIYFPATPVFAAGGVNQSESPVSIELTTYFDPFNVITSTITNRNYGDVLTLESSLSEAPSENNYRFLYWEQNGKIRHYPQNHTFVLTQSNVMKAIYSPDNRYVVAFVDTNDSILKIQYVEANGNATPPSTLPSKLGYSLMGWSGSYESVTSDLIISAQYELNDNSMHTIEVRNGTISEAQFAFNAVANVVAMADSEGSYFHHWTANGLIRSYEASHAFTVLNDEEWIAVFASEQPQAEPRVFLSENLDLRKDEFKRTFVGHFELPERYQLIEYGIIGHSELLTSLDLSTPGLRRYPSNKLNAATQEWMMSIASGASQTVRAYLICRNFSNELITVYDDSIHRITNGSFESGDLEGWTPYQLWKDESPLSAFRNERVVKTSMYGSSGTNPYDMSGEYLFGVYATPYDNANKDLNQERMGMMKSSNFVLGGSGYLSFRLGGGKNTATAYLSVRDALTHEEIARYGNRHFGNTSIASVQYGLSIANAEAFLFQYYADLRAYVGDELYLVLVDGASHEWNVLALDDVQTYLPVVGHISSQQLAQNITPQISQTGSAPNSFTNGSMTSNLDQWENPNNVFQIANGGAISSVGGNAALGVLRSPAFSLAGGNKILKYDFAGAIQRDKQVFVSIKETMTHQEVLRLVRRNDLASSADSGEFKTHWYDLSGLPIDKEYYLEVVDNRNGDWGVAMIRNVVLTNTTDADYRMAENVYGGLSSVDPITGDHRSKRTELVTLSDADVFLSTISLGASADNTMNISFHSRSFQAIVEYTTDADPYFLQSTKSTLIGQSFSSTISDVNGVLYGFYNQYVFQTALTSLTSETTYLYRIWDGSDVCQTQTFVTGPESGTAFRFLYFTDTQALTYQNAMITHQLINESYQHYSDYAFKLITGDLVERGTAALYWDRFIESNHDSLPILSVPGNHDYYGSVDTLIDASHYNSMFNNPKNGITQYLNSSYYVNYGNVLFIMIDVVTGQNSEAQIAWFESVVAQNTQDFIIVGMHYSAYGTTHTTTAEQIRNTWIPVFDASNVDLVLSGHDHIYARTPAIINAIEAEEGTFYLIGGSAGHKLYDVSGSPTNFSYYMVPTLSSLSMISVTSSQIVIETMTLSGAIIDTLTILKRVSD